MSMKKVTIKQQTPEENSQDEDELKFCMVCQKRAAYKCGQCLQVAYCTPQHQKGDWAQHKRHCIRPEEKLKELYSLLQKEKKVFFQKLSKKMTADCEGICSSILKISKEIVEKFPSPQHEIEYGTSVCCYVRMLLSIRNFNEAHEAFNNYLKQKDDFLIDTSNIPERIKPEDPGYKSTILFVQGKLKLLSVLCNLTHQIARQSINAVQILLQHCEKFYGKNSLQVSNVYFEVANYYNFLQQYYKACGCYLIAGKMRKEKGLSSFYNAAIMLMRLSSYHKAIQFFNKCLEMIEMYGDSNSISDRIFLGLAYCYKKLNHFDNTVQYLEKALCMLTSKYRFGGNQEERDIRRLLKLLSDEYKKQFNNDQILNLPKQVIPEPQNEIFPAQSNIDDFMQLCQDNSKRKKQEQWKKSFKNQTDKTKFQSTIPMTNPLVQKVLFFNHYTDDKNDEANQKSASVDEINIDLAFMESLTVAEVEFLNQLSKTIISNKQKTAIYEIVENSNLIQQLSKEKRQRFYELNPKLMKVQEDFNVIMEEQEEGSGSIPVDTNKPQNQKAPLQNQPQSQQPPVEKLGKGNKGFKLDLQKVHKNRQQLNAR